MQEWRTRWQVNLDWRPGRSAGQVVEQHVDTVGELREVVMGARANPDVVRCRYVPVRELVGEPPHTCRRGHHYDGGSFTRVRLDWSVCPCGGHMVYRCRWRDCGDVRLDPEPAIDCLPSTGSMGTTIAREGNP